jgi:hypothetical protein
MWSKTKQTFESRLPEDLKGRVKYQYDVYRDGSSEIQSMSIRVDGEVWFCTDPRFWSELYKMDYNGRNGLEVIKNTGYVGNSWGEAMKYVHQFLNVLSIDEAIASENYFIRMLALLDSRLGKRRIRKLAEHVEEEPEWFRKWIMLRLRKQV